MVASLSTYVPAGDAGSTTSLYDHLHQLVESNVTPLEWYHIEALARPHGVIDRMYTTVPRSLGKKDDSVVYEMISDAATHRLFLLRMNGVLETWNVLTNEVKLTLILFNDEKR